jgi:hypothetical protein
VFYLPDETKFLRAVGFGKNEATWITQYDSWALRGGSRNKYTLVGRGAVTSSFCGKHKLYYKCDAVELHHGFFKNKDIWHNTVLNCHRPSCPRCWKYGWAVREANSIDSRFLTAERVLGLPYTDVEHLQASVPKSEYDLSYKDMSGKAILALKASNVYGGNIIFHGFRKDYDNRELFPSYHFHCLGYVQGGYKCRDCEHLKCSRKMRIYCDAPVGSCDGFEQVTRKAHVNDGWIVSLAKNENGVVEKRKNLFGTSWYQLEHSSLEVGVRRFQIVKWFGAVNNCKLKTVHNPVKHTCAVCHSPMVVGFPDGVTIVSNRGEHGFVKNFMTDHVEDDVGLGSEESEGGSVPVTICLGCGRKLPAGFRSKFCSYNCFQKYKEGGG